MTTLSIVIPALNEEDSIASIMGRVLAVGPKLSPVGVSELELIVVDDGSTDRTAEIVHGTPGATLVQHPVNKGYGAALKTGFRAAHGELLAFLDADGTYPPEYFPQLCQTLLQPGPATTSWSARAWPAPRAKCPPRGALATWCLPA